MGYEYKGICYSTEAQASDAFFGAYTPSSFLSGSNLVQNQFVSIAGAWKLVQTQTDASGVQSVNYIAETVQPTFRTCDYANDPSEHFKDGMALGWATVGIMVVVWAIRRAYR